ncbi:phospholipase D family protein [Burkholderia cenocepacia]|uniref:phospholipase D family nuclease n=1 Tax=Burkholderia cenocepacia TaxID=95486 RepID=UPI0023B9D0D9|nr:phospholipase D family protein [Burkholderia cenocepacia]MDF0506836.1 phospholipase D family protein [Burkholderia cenocepacia]
MTRPLVNRVVPVVIACVGLLGLVTPHSASAEPGGVAVRSAPAGRVNSVAFSPDGNGMELVLYGVSTAHRSIHVLAYVMTYRPLIDALAAKALSGVDVSIAVDYSESIVNDRTGSIRRGLDYLVRAGATVCVVDRYRLMHDKSMILDQQSVQTGSINYSAAGAKSNSENVVVAWNDPALAEAFERHFQSRMSQCRARGQLQ